MEIILRTYVDKNSEEAEPLGQWLSSHHRRAGGRTVKGARNLRQQERPQW